MVKNKRILMFALLLAIIFTVATSGCTEKESRADATRIGNANSPNDVSDLPAVSAADPKVFDKSYAQHLLDQTMMSATKDAKKWKTSSDFILLYIKANKGDLTWSPEKVTLTEGKAFDEGVLYFGLEDLLGNSFYAGPVVCWYQEKPGDPVIYETSFVATTGGDFTEWRERPYKYGVETYADPPPEILKVFSDNGAILHY